MPTGIYKRTPEMKIGKHMKGRKLSEEIRNKISIALKEKKRLSIFERLKGHIPWNKGKNIGNMSEEHRNKIRLARLGKPHPCKTHKEKKFTPWTKKEWDAHYLKYPNKPKIYKKQLICFFRYKSRDKEYPLDWVELRREIYKRDNWTCQECGEKCCNEIKIQCHHIDYNINNTNSSNLITLCASCHSKTNYRRQDWMNYFKDRLLLTFPLKEEKPILQKIEQPTY